jgi:hypothetical protein
MIFTQECWRIKLTNVDSDNWTFIGGIKPDAGRERKIGHKISDITEYI